MIVGQQSLLPSALGHASLLRLHLKTGRLTTFADVDGQLAGWGNGAAWVGVANPADPKSGLAFKGDTPDEIDQIELSGKRTPWFYLPGTVAQLADFDASGAPLILSRATDQSDAWDLIRVPTPNNFERLLRLSYDRNDRMESDFNGTWITGAGDYTLFHISNGKIGRVPIQFADKTENGQHLVPAGPCL